MYNTIDKENTVRILQERPQLREVEQIVASIQHYVATYDTKQFRGDPDVFIEDMLYGIGRAMSEEYIMAAGFWKFKRRIKEKLENIK